MPTTPAPKPTPAPPSFSTFTRLKKSKTFLRIADRAVELRKLVAIGDAAKEELRKLAEDQLEPELLAGGVGEGVTIDYNGVRVRIIDKASGSRIDPDLLIRAGVSKKTIEAATVENKRQHYISIDLPLDTINDALRSADLTERGSKRAKGASGSNSNEEGE